MSFGEKLSKLRKSSNYTQEQLADLLDVSRQSISKWESDLAYPETEKIIKISSIFDCSIDYLLKDNVNEKASYIDSNEINNNNDNSMTFMKRIFKERKSEKTLWGLPLYHIGKNAKGIIAIGLNAKGIVAIGLKSIGVLSFGLFSIGLISVGLLSLALLSFGLFAIGLLAAGCFSLGIISLGAISFGIVSMGAIAVGQFSVGALAIGNYVAIGDIARGMIAIGDTQAVGTVYSHLGYLAVSEISEAVEIIDKTVPKFFAWAREIIKLFL